MIKLLRLVIVVPEIGETSTEITSQLARNRVIFLWIKCINYLYSQNEYDRDYQNDTDRTQYVQEIYGFYFDKKS